jgi:hypothetical protein
MDTIAHLTEDTFEAAVKRPGLMVIDFWAAGAAHAARSRRSSNAPPC